MATSRERKGINVVSNLLSGNIGNINKKHDKQNTNILKFNKKALRIKNKAFNNDDSWKAIVIFISVL